MLTQNKTTEKQMRIQARTYSPRSISSADLNFAKSFLYARGHKCLIERTIRDSRYVFIGAACHLFPVVVEMFRDVLWRQKMKTSSRNLELFRNANI